MSGKGSRNKGANAEREVAKIINDRLGTDLKRTPLSGGMQFKGDIIGWDGFSLEIKRQETLKIMEWIRQCERDAPSGDVPVVVFRKSREPWRVVLTLDNFLSIVEKGV